MTMWNGSNPFTIPLGLGDFLAAWWNFSRGEWMMGTVWVCYGVATLLLGFQHK